MVHHRLAQLALRNDPQPQHALRLNAPKRRTLSGWLDQASLFYINALAHPGVLDALARFNVTQDHLEQGQALVQQVAELNSVQEREKAEAQQATQDRDAALDALDEWVADFRAVARMALAGAPQQLESLQLGAIP